MSNETAKIDANKRAALLGVTDDANAELRNVLIDPVTGRLKVSAIIGGSVVGPGSSTDNAIVRWDGTDGETIQNSGITIDDSDNISGINNVTGVDTDLVSGTAGTNGNVAQWNGDGDIVDSSVAVVDILTTSDKTGADAGIVSGTAGTSGNVVQWNGDGDAVDGGVAVADILVVSDKTGSDAGVVSGTAGTNGNLVEWNGDGDAVDSGLATSDVVTGSSTDTFTNKTFDANGTGNSISNIAVSDMAAAAVVTEAEGIPSNDNDTSFPTSAAVKDYVDNNGGGGTWSDVYEDNGAFTNIITLANTLLCSHVVSGGTISASIEGIRLFCNSPSEFAGIRVGQGNGFAGDLSSVWENFDMTFSVTMSERVDSQDTFWGFQAEDTVVDFTGTAVTAGATSTDEHIGFYIEDGTLYASNANGTTQTRTDISAGITLDDVPHMYRIIFTGGTDIKFYVDGTLEATHTTNLPSMSDFQSIAFATEQQGNFTCVSVISDPVIKFTA